jgi:phytoene dehydrogenase-like protein
MGIPFFFTLGATPGFTDERAGFLNELTTLKAWSARYPDTRVSVTHGFPWRAWLNADRTGFDMPAEMWEPFRGNRIHLEVSFPIRIGDVFDYPYRETWPMLEATIPSLADPSLIEGAAPGTHVMSVIVQATPHTLRDTTWDDARESLGDLVVRTLDGYAPGLAGSVVARQVITPVDLERDFGLTGGHPMHGEHGLDQFYLWRPLLGHARYRLGLDGLYLAGAGAHPGGGVTGQNGQNAAREIVGDLKRRRRGT